MGFYTTFDFFVIHTCSQNGTGYCENLVQTTMEKAEHTRSRQKQQCLLGSGGQKLSCLILICTVLDTALGIAELFFSFLFHHLLHRLNRTVKMWQEWCAVKEKRPCAGQEELLLICLVGGLNMMTGHKDNAGWFDCWVI